MNITYDNSLSFVVVGSGATSTSFNVGSGPGRVLLVNTGPKITAITYNGVSMDLVIDFTPSIMDGNEQRVKVWRLNNPTIGSNTLQFTISSGDEIVGIISYKNVDVEVYQPIQSATGYSNNGLINIPVVSLSTTVVTTIDNSISIMFIRGGANFPQTFTAGSGTLRLSDTSILSNAFGIIDSGTPISPAGNSTLQADWTSGSGFMSNVIFTLSPAKAGGMLPFFL